MQNLGAIASRHNIIANLPTNAVTVQCTALVTVVVESNHKNALLRRGGLHANQQI